MYTRMQDVDAGIDLCLSVHLSGRGRGIEYNVVSFKATPHRRRHQSHGVARWANFFFS